VGKADGLRFMNTYHKDFRTRCQDTMSDPGIAPKNQRQIDSLANLFFLLQTLSSVTHATEPEELAESSHHEQIETYISQNGLVL
jgi:hypothetical protein